MALQDIVLHYRDHLLAREGQRLTTDQHSALNAIAGCRQGQYGNLLIQCAVATLKTFGLNKKGFEAELGLCAVLHTHTRRLDYLFNGRALAATFRGALLKALAEAGLSAGVTPKKWVAQCQKVGRGDQALQYLSRYLYRGVISNFNILADDGDTVTFQYRDGNTGRWQTRSLTGEDFLAQLVQHVLPKAFRRARDYGFPRGNARALLNLVQWVLQVQRLGRQQIKKPSGRLCCPCCGGALRVMGYRLPRGKPG